MIDDLEFLRGETEKLQKAIRKESGNNYKKYATLFQAYLTAKTNVQQLEMYKKQQEEERKRQEEIEKTRKEAERQLAEEEEIKKSNIEE